MKLYANKYEYLEDVKVMSEKEGFTVDKITVGEANEPGLFLTILDGGKYYHVEVVFVLQAVMIRPLFPGTRLLFRPEVYWKNRQVMRNMLGEELSAYTELVCRVLISLPF